jgi:hypothetical protein
VPGQVVLPLSLTATLPQPVTVAFSVKSGTTQIGDGPGSDLAGATGEITLPAGDLSDVSLTPLTGDELAEDDETFTLQLQTATTPAVIDPDCVTATGTIEDDDRAPVVVCDVPGRGHPQL